MAGEPPRLLDRSPAVAPPMVVAAVRSQNGYSCPTNAVTRKALLTSYRVPGTRSQRITLRRGSAGALLVWWLGEWNAHVEPLAGSPSDEWGFAERDIRGSSTEVSNHASGTAVDGNAAEHPLGTDTFDAAKTARVHALLNREYGGIRVGSVLRWGGDYTDRLDQMHTEINAPPKRVTALWHAIEAAAKPKPSKPVLPPTFPPDTSGEDDMAKRLYRVTGTAPVYVADGIHRRWLTNPDDEHFQQQWLEAEGHPSTVIEIHASQLPYIGVLDGPAPK